MSARFEVGAHSEVYARDLSLREASRRAQKDSRKRPGITIMVWQAGPPGAKAVGKWLDGRPL